MIEQNNVRRDIGALFDATAFDNSGDKLGSINELYLDDRTGAPTFAKVSHGLFGLSSSIVPLKGATLEGTALNLGFSKNAIEDAPHIDEAHGLSKEEEAHVYEHYHLTDAAHYPTSWATADATPGAQISDPDTTVHTEKTIEGKAPGDFERVEGKAPGDFERVEGKAPGDFESVDQQFGERTVLRRYIIEEGEIIERDDS